MSRRKLSWLAIAALLTLGIVLAACGGDDDDGGGGGDAENARFDLTIADLVPLTGDLSTYGPPGRKAADIAYDEIRKGLREANVDGVDVSIEHADTETDPQAAVSTARRLVSQDANCIVGPWASAEVRPVGTNVAARRRIPMITPSATAPSLTDLRDNGFVYRTAPSDALQAAALSDLIERKLEGTEGTVSLTARNDDYGEGFANAFKDIWEERGGQVQGPVLYDPQGSSFNSEAEEVVRGNPDAIVVIDFPDTYAKFGPALVRAGGDDFDASKIYVADGLAVPDLAGAKIRESTLDGATGTRPSTSGGSEGAFDRLYKAAEGGPNDRGTYDIQTFDAVVLCFLAALKAGSADPEAIQEQLEDVSGPGGEKFTFQELPQAIEAVRNGDDIDYEGVSGPVDFDENGDPGAATYEEFVYRNGKLDSVRKFPAGGEEGGGEE